MKDHSYAEGHWKQKILWAKHQANTSAVCYWNIPSQVWGSVILTPAAKHYVDHNSISSNNWEVYFEREWRRAGKNATAEAA